MDTVLSRLFLELSHCTTAKTEREIKLEADFIKMYEIAVKWVDPDDHDWNELMNLRWGDKYEVSKEPDKQAVV